MNWKKGMPCQGSTIGLFKVKFSYANKKNDVMFMLFQFLCGDGYILPIKISKYATHVYEIDKFLCAIRLILIHSLFSKLKLIDHLLDLQ